MRFSTALSAIAVLAFTDAAFAAPAAPNPTPAATPPADAPVECETDVPVDPGHDASQDGSDDNGGDYGGDDGGDDGGDAGGDNGGDGAAGGLSLTAQLQLADTAADRFNLLPKDSDFVFDFNKDPPSAGKGGELVAANRKSFQALVGTGMGMAVGRVNPCGMNTLHVHPRSAELQIVTAGKLVTEMLPENGVLDKDGNRRVIRTTLTKGMMTPFYQGSVHTQYNPDCEPAEFVAAFASEDFGTGQVADQTFALSDNVILATFGQSFDGDQLEEIRSAIPASIANGVEECLKTCGIEKK